MTATQRDRAIEAAVDAEKATLGAILVHGHDAYDLAADVLGAQASTVWFRIQHTIIWTVITRLVQQRAPVDLVTVATALTADEAKEVSPVYLSALLDDGRAVSSVSAMARLVRDAKVRRDIAEIARRVVLDAEIAEESVDGLLESAEASLYALHAPTAQAEILAPPKRASALMEALDEKISSKGAIRYSTGLSDLDAVTRGFKPGQLWAVGARPGMGKSALAMTLAINASKHGAVGFVSLEMSADELGLRELAIRGGIEFWRLDAGLIRPDDPRIRAGFDALADGNLHFVNQPGSTVASIRRAARRLHAQHGGLALLVVDYLQLVKVEKDQRYNNRVVEVGMISHGLKELALELEITVLALSQLKRASEQNPSKRPTLADFRESGDIEQDADVALLLHRQGYYERDNEAIQNHALLDLAKQRNGPTGEINLVWHREHMMFTDGQQTV